MALILSLDSTASVCSVALHQDGKWIDTIFMAEPRAASSQLMVSVRNLLSRNAIKPSEISAIAVSSGPGSYTGLRISSSSAKGLCYALNVQLIAVNSLLVLAYAQIKEHGMGYYYCPMLDARRMEVYCALIQSNQDFVTEIEPKVLTTNSFQSDLDQHKIFFFGDGAQKFKPLANHPNAIFVDGVHPEAKYLGYLAHEKYLAKQFECVEDFEPMYLKDFMIKKKQEQSTQI